MREEGRAEIRVTMEDPGDGLYRAALVGDEGELALGVLEPQNGRLLLRRRPYLREVERLGTLHGVQAVCSFSFRQRAMWQRTARPAELAVGDVLRSRLAAFSCAWWRREGEQLTLALPFEEGKPFPLEMFFCFGRVKTVEGCRCVLYTLDAQGRPL